MSRKRIRLFAERIKMANFWIYFIAGLLSIAAVITLVWILGLTKWGHEGNKLDRPKRSLAERFFLILVVSPILIYLAVLGSLFLTGIIVLIGNAVLGSFGFSG